ncbi:MAG TPA: ABC transporter permease, partial [Dehalococcoidia bacterium]|nr:ABC transporter permease [Dehalococcoidia bacterium]
GTASGFIILGFVLVALASPWMAPHNPHAFVGPSLQAPTRLYPFGTNNLGQDILSRVIYGSQVSLAVGVSAVLLGTIAGTTLGLLSGYFGGWIDMIIQRALEIVAAFPGLVLILVVIAALGRPHVSASTNIVTLAWQLRVIVIAIAIGFVFAVTRVVRSVTIGQRGSTYVDAAKSCGAGWQRVIVIHILPNVVPYIIVGATAALGFAILLEAAVSFLGYGVPPGTPSWGADLSGPSRQFFLQAPWLALSPGAAISLTLLGFNLLGDSLRDVLDPRLRGG